MPEVTDWNTKIIDEFRANEGRVGGPFEGAPMVLVTHRGRKSGHQHVTPMMYLPDETDDDIVYVFASKGGAPTNPGWYYNLTSAGHATIAVFTHRAREADVVSAVRWIDQLKSTREPTRVIRIEEEPPLGIGAVS